jgi:hypothetical protein
MTQKPSQTKKSKKSKRPVRRPQVEMFRKTIVRIEEILRVKCLKN